MTNPIDGPVKTPCGDCLRGGDGYHYCTMNCSGKEMLRMDFFEETYTAIAEIVKALGTHDGVARYTMPGVEYTNMRTSPAGPYEAICTERLVVYRRAEAKAGSIGHCQRIDFRIGGMPELAQLLSKLKGEAVEPPSDLLPCRCGGRGEPGGLAGLAYVVLCRTCGARTGHKPTAAQATEEWNRYFARAGEPATRPPRFEKTSCSSCGRNFGPGDHGYSHCDQHQPPEVWIPELIRNEYDPVPGHYLAGEKWDDGADEIAHKIIERIAARAAAAPAPEAGKAIAEKIRKKFQSSIDRNGPVILSWEDCKEIIAALPETTRSTTGENQCQ